MFSERALKWHAILAALANQGLLMNCIASNRDHADVTPNINHPLPLPCGTKCRGRDHDLQVNTQAILGDKT
jgi:hypothetical protein